MANADLEKLQTIGGCLCAVLKQKSMLMAHDMGEGCKGYSDNDDWSQLSTGNGQLLHEFLVTWKAEKQGYTYGATRKVGKHPDMVSWEDLPRRRQELYSLAAAILLIEFPCETDVITITRLVPTEKDILDALRYPPKESLCVRIMKKLRLI